MQERRPAWGSKVVPRRALGVQAGRGSSWRGGKRPLELLLKGRPAVRRNLEQEVISLWK